MTNIMLDPPTIPMAEWIRIYYGMPRWYCDILTTRGDRLELTVKGPNDEQTYKAFVSVVRATVMAMGALGAAVDDARDTAKDIEE